MCGITGWISYRDDRPVERAVLERMTRALTHRGPDDEGYFCTPRLGLGHRRLSIVDLSPRGRQPMFNETGRIAVLLNGEIYNFPTLKTILQADGHVFRSDTDTEVIVHGYEKWGEGLLERLDGMFSLAIADLDEQRLLLAQDPFGKKPLFVSLGQEGLLFASELKAFLPVPWFRRVIDRQAVRQYLAGDYLQTPATIWEGCCRLPAGAFVRVSLRERPAWPLPTRRYWRLPFEPKSAFSEPEARERFEDLFRAALRKRLMSDVPLGVFLSGGIDSSAITAFLTEMQPAGKIATFTIGFSAGSFDESRFAREVARRFGTDHHEEILAPETMLEVLPGIFDKLDEPFADASIVPTFLLCRFARRRVTVALGGDGADELFAGYDPFVAERLAPLFSALPDVGWAALRWLAARIPVSDANMSLGFRLNQFLKGFPAGYPPREGRPQPRQTRSDTRIRNALWMSSFPPDRQGDLLIPSSSGGGGIGEAAGHVCADRVFPSPIGPAVPGNRPCDRLIAQFINGYLHDDILVKVDRASMMNSLEVRAPFLDKQLAEFVCRLPVGFKMRGLGRKVLLKGSLAGRLPADLLARPKKGFGIPVAEWLRGPLKPLATELFDPGRIRAGGWFRPEAVRGLWERHLARAEDNRRELWNLLVFEYWRQRQGL